MRWRDPLLLIALLLAGWQLAATSCVGDVALSPPLRRSKHAGGNAGETRASSRMSARPLRRLRCRRSPLRSRSACSIGLTLGASRLAGEVAEPILVALYSIPKVTLYPVILLVFGIGMPAKVAFGAIHGIVPISLFAMNAIRNISAGAPAHRARAAALAGADGGTILLPRGAAGDRDRHPRRLFADADRHAARRDVRRAARPGLPADAGDEPARDGARSCR